MSGLRRMRSPWRDPAAIWLGVSVLLAVVIGALLLVLPLSESVSCGGLSVAPGTETTATETRCYRARHTLLDQEGWRAAAVLIIPALLCAAPLSAPRPARRPVTLGATALLGAAVILGAASFGLFYLPVLVTMAIAAVHTHSGEGK